MKTRFAIVAIVVASVALSRASDSQVRVIKTDEGCQFYEGAKPVLFYRTVAKATEDGRYARADYCHPVYGLDGQVLTEDFPADHLHHRGIFWAWHQVCLSSAHRTTVEWRNTPKRLFE